MAGTPAAALVTIGLPDKFEPEFVARIYDGLNALAQEHGVAVYGGETTTNPGGIFFPSRCSEPSAGKTNIALRRQNRGRDFCDR